MDRIEWVKIPSHATVPLTTSNVSNTNIVDLVLLSLEREWPFLFPSETNGELHKYKNYKT
jgi:hypothetical protein